MIERRRHRRWAMTLDGSVRLSQHDAFPCRSEDVSPGGMCVTAPVPIAPGTRIVLQFEQLGRLVGFARRSTGATFGVVLHAATEERERLTAKLTWLVNRSSLALADARRDARFVPCDGTTRLRLGDGSVHGARIADLSQSGALVMTRQPLAIGSTVAMEDRLSLVIRTLKGGVALRFLEPFSRHDLGERVARRMIEPAVTSPGQTGWSRDGGLRA